MRKVDTSLTAAKRAGRKNYFTGKPCKRGHIARRLTANGACTECESERKYLYDKTQGGRESYRRRGRRYVNPLRAKFPEMSDEEFRMELRRRKSWRASGYPQPLRPMPDACEICGKTIQDNKKMLALDHCHVTNTFRGWLCDFCNKGIGLLVDNLSGLMGAVRYLESHEESINQGEMK